jgi:hypothetical protein
VTLPHSSPLPRFPLSRMEATAAHGSQIHGIGLIVHETKRTQRGGTCRFSCSVWLSLFLDDNTGARVAGLPHGLGGDGVRFGTLATGLQSLPLQGLGWENGTNGHSRQAASTLREPPAARASFLRVLTLFPSRGCLREGGLWSPLVPK